jgi:hypothetical protein
MKNTLINTLDGVNLGQRYYVVRILSKTWGLDSARKAQKTMLFIEETPYAAL